MARSGLRQTPAAKAQTTSPKPSPAITPPKIKVKAIALEPATVRPLKARQPAAKKAALAPLKGTSCDPDCNHSEPVPALLQVTVGRNLRAARLAAGLTLRQVAELSGILFQYVYKIENGEKNLTLSTIANLAKVLHVNASDLLRDNTS